MIKKIPATVMLSSAIFLSPFSLQANELDLRVSDDTIHANATLSEQDSKASFAIGYFYKDGKHSANIINADIHAKGQTALGNLPATVSIGLQGNAFKQGSFKGTAIGLGGSIRVNIPQTPGLSVESALHYAPNVLAFGDADEFSRFRLQTNYRLIENADVSFGYQYLNAGFSKGPNHTFESGVFLGLKMKF